eukprot:jgi/Psemu1/306896/fgenesh1_kg.288_\
MNFRDDSHKINGERRRPIRVENGEVGATTGQTSPIRSFACVGVPWTDEFVSC